MVCTWCQVTDPSTQPKQAKQKDVAVAARPKVWHTASTHTLCVALPLATCCYVEYSLLRHVTRPSITGMEQMRLVSCGNSVMGIGRVGCTVPSTVLQNNTLPAWHIEYAMQAVKTRHCVLPSTQPVSARVPVCCSTSPNAFVKSSAHCVGARNGGGSGADTKPPTSHDRHQAPLQTPMKIAGMGVRAGAGAGVTNTSKLHPSPSTSCVVS